MSHWYDSTGKSCYTIKGANGKERDTTLRDARKLNLVPSVTTITQILDKPQLNIWKLDQVLQAAFARRQVNLDEKQWRAMVLAESSQISNQSSTRGTQIHYNLEQYFIDGSIFSLDAPFLNPVLEAMEKEFGSNLDEFLPEMSFASSLGYGGKIDLLHKDKQIILDFKTKNSNFEEKKVFVPEDHIMQLAAYAYGIDMGDAVCYNIYISTVKPGQVEIHKWSNDEKLRGWEMFKALLQYWKVKNNI